MGGLASASQHSLGSTLLEPCLLHVAPRLQTKGGNSDCLTHHSSARLGSTRLYAQCKMLGEQRSARYLGTYVGRNTGRLELVIVRGCRGGRVVCSLIDSCGCVRGGRENLADREENSKVSRCIKRRKCVRGKRSRLSFVANPRLQFLDILLGAKVTNTFLPRVQGIHTPISPPPRICSGGRSSTGSRAAAEAEAPLSLSQCGRLGGPPWWGASEVALPESPPLGGPVPHHLRPQTCL